MTLTFVDTGAWIALLKRDDRMRERARGFYARRVSEGAGFLTTNYVVDETATRLGCDARLEAALGFRRTLDRSVSERRLRVAWVDPRSEPEGWEILELYADAELSLTDATSVAVARRARVRDCSASMRISVPSASTFNRRGEARRAAPVFG